MNIPLLLRAIEAAGHPVPVADIASARAEVAEIRAFGYDIDLHADGGVRYFGPAARLCPDLIEWELGTKLIGRRVAVWNRVASTNDLAARASGSLANDGLVILAEEQTAGRGSRGRSWIAPPASSILMSVLLFPPAPLASPAWLTALAAVAVAEAIEFGDLAPRPAGAHRDVRIKWPNDILVDGRKVAGILVERGRGTVIGIGLNVNLARDDFPDELRETATSLSRAFGRPLDRSLLVRKMLGVLDRLYDGSITGGPDRLNSEYERRSDHLGHDVEVSTSSGVVTGRLGTLDLRMGLGVGRSHDDCRQVPIEEVTAIVNRPGSRRWTRDEAQVDWWGADPDTVYRSTPAGGC